MNYKGSGVFRRYVRPPPSRRLAQELSCVMDTSEPYRAPDAKTVGMYDYEPEVNYANAKLSRWTYSRKKDGTRIIF